MGFFSNILKNDEDERKSAYAPTGGATEKQGAAGKGGGEPAKPSYDPSKKADIRKIQKSLNDRRYGYIDENTGVEVPWYIDMINGGGMNAAGDTFEGAGLYSAVANAAGVAPYGYNRPRTYAQAGMQGYPTAAVPAPTGGGGSSTVTPDPINVPQDFSNLSNAPAIRSGLIGYNPQVVAGTPRPSPSTAAQTTPQMDYLMNIAQQTVARRFPTMPEADRQMAIQGEYQRLVNSIGM